MKEIKFYNSRVEMTVMFILSLVVFALMGVSIFLDLGNKIYWPRLIANLLVMLLLFYMVIYSGKQIMRPNLLATLTKTGVLIEKYKSSSVIRWEDIESYMIYRKPSMNVGSTNFYLFLKEGITYSDLPKQIKIDYNYMKNKQKLKEMFDEKQINELDPDHEIIKNSQ